MSTTDKSTRHGRDIYRTTTSSTTVGRKQGDNSFCFFTVYSPFFLQAQLSGGLQHTSNDLLDKPGSQVSPPPPPLLCHINAFFILIEQRFTVSPAVIVVFPRSDRLNNLHLVDYCYYCTSRADDHGNPHSYSNNLCCIIFYILPLLLYIHIEISPARQEAAG